MDEQVSGTQHDEEEISLVDLFSVIIRYRKVIAVGTGIAVCAAALYLFVLPHIFPSLNKEKYEVQYALSVIRVPPSLNSEFPEVTKEVTKTDAFASRVFSLVNDPSFIAAVFKAYPFTDAKVKKLDPYEYNSYIRQTVLKESLNFELSDSTLLVTCMSSDIDSVKKFIIELVNALNTQLKSTLSPQFARISLKTENIISENRNFLESSTVDVQSLNSLLQIKSDLDVLIGTDQFVTVSSDAFVVGVPQKRMMNLVIVFFAAFFLFVFIAFLLNAVANKKKIRSVPKKS
ncbi:LPS biosynthesis protein [Treponema brennaborense]|uniref:Lipopolysaccharide biosynthesis protein n=1 Tax=Treponema brennaborense (strain DSM 12168 / CIP 105900 / DD5/3) TaxID=906968 RepID=F4LJG4_TREBD|nr:LPS biosynthesis protein [Treponema brennaborense]AEE16359.1 lipopolysaccharide biosynthesis protein [Treponema brennaborense DSM 12168]